MELKGPRALRKVRVLSTELLCPVGLAHPVGHASPSSSLLQVYRMHLAALRWEPRSLGAELHGMEKAAPSTDSQGSWEVS